MTDSASHISTKCVAMAYVPHRDGSRIYGKQWQVTASSNQQLVGEKFTILTDSRVADKRRNVVGRMRRDGDQKFIEIGKISYVWRERDNKPVRIEMKQRIIHGTTCYFFSEEAVDQLKRFSSLAAECLQLERDGYCLKLRPRGQSQEEHTFEPFRETDRPICLDPENGKKTIYIPGSADGTSRIIKLVIERLNEER